MAKRKPIKRPNIDIPWFGGSDTSGTIVELRGQKSKPVPASRGKGVGANNTTFKDNRNNSYYDRSGQPGGSRFVRGEPTFPQPQSIKNMPPQLAGFTDYARKDEDLYSYSKLSQNTAGRRINVAGKPASGIQVSNLKSTQDFLNTKSVLVDPMYKDPYDKIGNDPDSSDRSRGPQIVSEDRQDTLRAIGKGVDVWAKATSKYFNKPVVVAKSPVFDNKNLGPLQTNVVIFGREAGDEYAGMVSMGGSKTHGLKKPNKILKAPGGENRITKAGPLQKTMTLNTDLDPYYDRMGPKKWANTTQHEFGHTMGLGHPHRDPAGTTLNSEMSYDAKDYGATILPATINAYKNVMNQNLGYTGVAELYKKYDKQDDAFRKLKNLNQKYEKKKKK